MMKEMMKRTGLGACGVLLTLAATWVVAQEKLPAGGNKPAAAKPATHPKAATPQAATPQAATDEEKYSYAIGHDMGNSFRSRETPLDVASLLAGLEAGLKGTEPRFDPETCY